MKVRELLPEDKDELRRIWEKFYTHEFDFPDFYRNFVCAFAVLDDDDSLITAGGVLPICEAIIVTDKDRTPRIRREALYHVLGASSFIADKFNYRQLHAFSQDPIWTRRMLKAGFKYCKGTALVLNLGDK